MHFADLGTRVFYCDQASFDTHAGQNPLHASLWTELTQGLEAFMADLRAHDKSDNVIVLIFSEFGRRVRDNGSGTDHGAAGVTFVLGDKVKGGHYGDMPSLDDAKLVQGDLNPEHGLPRHLLDDSREVDAPRRQADRKRPLRAAGFPELAAVATSPGPEPRGEPLQSMDASSQRLRAEAGVMGV